MTPALDKRLRQGNLDLIFSAAPTVGEDFVNEALPPMAMVFVGPDSLGQAMRLDAFVGVQTLRNHNATGKRIHAISSIWAMVKLVESGFGLATLPLAVAEEPAASQRIAILATGTEASAPAVCRCMPVMGGKLTCRVWSKPLRRLKLRRLWQNLKKKPGR